MLFVLGTFANFIIRTGLVDPNDAAATCENITNSEMLFRLGLIGLASFGVHLILIGYLLVTSRWAPRALGIVIAAAGAAYIVDTLAYGLLPSYADYASVFLVMVAVPSVIGEFAFTLWLLLRGGKQQLTSGADKHLPAR